VTQVKIAVVPAVALLLIHGTCAHAAQEKVEVRAYVNDACVLADEPYFLPETGEQLTARALPFAGIIVGKLAELLIKYVVKTTAGRISSSAARKDTRYAAVKEANLFRAELQPSPTLRLNSHLGCMTIVAGAFQPDSASCSAAYLPKEITRELALRPQAEWRTTRADNSMQNRLRRANICTAGEPRAVYESRFEFSDDGTAYRLKNAGYSVDTLLTTTDKKATRSVFYTLEISEPGRNDKRETLSTAWVKLGDVTAGSSVTDVDDDSAPWLRVPSLSPDARRAYEQQTRTHQEVFAEIGALERAIVREQRVITALDQRIGAATPQVAEGLAQQKLKSEIQVQTLEAQLQARKEEYADLPQTPLEFMPVSIEVGVTESTSEKRALAALAKVVESSSDMVASVGVTVASGLIARSLDAPQEQGKPDPGAELESSRAAYFDALVNLKTQAAGADATKVSQDLSLAKTRYNDARRVLGLEAVE
jgi:hypothetical protein